MEKQVDSYRFITGITKRMVKTWVGMEKPRDIPWTPLTKDLSDCTVAMIVTAGMALKSDQPFDQEGERRNPWRGDPSYRVIPSTATERDVSINHLHINPAPALQDLNCMLPLQRLQELESMGEIGHSAPRHYSIMGYLPNPEQMLRESVPAIIEHLRQDQVDIVLLVPV
jgi:D-proline reductase (dithiol) PrdB